VLLTGTVRNLSSNCTTRLHIFEHERLSREPKGKGRELLQILILRDLAYRDPHWVLQMTGDVFTLAFLLAGCFGLFLGAIWYIERRGNREVREAERAQQAKRDAAIEAERAKAESGERERALQAKQKAARDARYAARKSRPKRAGRFAHYMGHKNFLHMVRSVREFLEGLKHPMR
jgi:hypothetical protein